MLAGAEEVKPSKLTIGTVLDQYLNAAQVNLKPRTITRYRVAIEVHLKPAFGTTRLHKLTALQVEELSTTSATSTSNQGIHVAGKNHSLG
jgi:hypothetical protein